jgi:invasion protein IalB
MSRNPWTTIAALLLVAGPLAAQADDEEAPAPVATAAATAHAATAEEPAATGAKRDAEPEVVCRVEAELGSRVKKKVCRRKVDIEAERSETQDALRDVRSLGNKNYNAAPGS